ncbi:MAG TPA: hypothetical protein VH092_35910 [Urbifossiella sp.]|nr:hypothetical protein [Urbifossiella sp.]
MYPKRIAPDDDQNTTDTDTPIMAETFRSASAGPACPPTKEEEKISVFWRVFGGTILSIVALVAITLYNNLQSSINELRAEVARSREVLAGSVKREDLDRERDARAGLAKKDEMDVRFKALFERIHTIEGFKVDIEGVKERANAATAAVDSLKREMGSSVDALKKDTATIDLLRERLTILAGETKVSTEAVSRLQAEVERNRAADLERKSSRDSQSKNVDDSLRELQRAVQDCREKLARLEGAMPTVTPASGTTPRSPVPAPRPSGPKSGD